MDEQGDPRSRRADLLAVGVNLANDAATGEMVRALQRDGVRAIVLKGLSVRHWLYGETATRISVDIDLLLDWRELAQAEAVLERLDYRYLGIDAVGAGRPHCRVWQHPSTQAFVELHRTIAGVGVSADAAWEVLSRQTDEMSVGQATVEVLAPPARALHVALHAAQHGQASEKTLADLERALERLPVGVWENAAALAERLDAVPAFAAGLTLVSAGESLASRLSLPSGQRLDVVVRAQSSPAATEGLVWLAQLPGVTSKAAFVFRQLVPPVGYMRIVSPLARRSRAGLALAYAYRPLWLLGHLAPALVAWLRARKQLGGSPS